MAISFGFIRSRAEVANQQRFSMSKSKMPNVRSLQLSMETFR